MTKKIKKELREWGIFLGVIGLLYFTGWHTEVFGTLQRVVLASGIIQPDLDGYESNANYEVSLVDLEGNAVNMQEWRGETIFLNLWATWCPPCIAEMPDINNLYNEVGSDVKFAIVSVDEDQEKAKKFAARKGFDFPIYLINAPLPSTYRTGSIPSTFVISPEGKIVVKRMGMAKYNTDKFKSFLRSLGSQNPS